MNYLDSLNTPQRNAVTTTEGPVLVIAGAGSGKTRVLTMRIAYLLQQGVKPYNILALTFTNKAAREMKERIATIVGPELSQQLWMGTFHSIFARILRTEAQALGLSRDFTIYDTTDSKSLLRTIIKNMQLDEKVYKLSNVLGAISQAKNDLIGPSGYAQDVNYTERDKSAQRPRTAEIYAQYALHCRKSNALDFDDLLYFTHLLFRDNPTILKRYQEKFKYVLVDEYQDTNRAQYVIVKKLVEQHHNICVVGDDAQSIYSFRGARIENILGLKNDYPQLQIFKLEQNYRSTQNIVNAANSLIEKNKGRLPKTVFSEGEDGDLIRVCSTFSAEQEAELVVHDLIARMHHESLTPNDFAILYRTNAQSRTFEDAFRKMHIPYKIYGGLAFYQRKEIKDVLAYLRLSVNHDDNEALKRIINFPARSIGNTTQERLIQLADVMQTSIWNVLTPTIMSQASITAATQNKILRFVSLIETFTQQTQTLNAYEFAAEVLTQSGIMKELVANQKDAEGKERYDNVNELLNSLNDYAQSRANNDEDNHIRSYLEEVALITDADSDDAATEKVRLMTIHSSKGLEFEHIYIVGVEDETFPGQQSIYNPKELEEERRLMYVAITRAKRSVTMSYCLSRFLYGQHKDCHPSRFIADIDSAYISRPENMNIDRPRSGFHFTEQPRSSFNMGKRTQMVNNPYVRRSASAYSQQRNLTPVSKTQSSFRMANQAQPLTMANGSTFSVGQRVFHDTFGAGVILAIEGAMPNAKLQIKFDKNGIKHLLAKFARLRPE